ncbi:MAG TPA: hypothetical protein VGF33_10000 [Caulobacteraceae bacterium]|jgi:hypothetical protein
MRLIASLIAALALSGAAQAQKLGVSSPTSPFVGKVIGISLPNGLSGPTGVVTAITVSSANWSSPTDLLPNTQYSSSWTADVTLSNMAPAGVTTAYAFGAPSPSNNKLAFTATSPGYTSAAAPTTVNRTIYATSWLRQVWPNYTLPTERANGGNAEIALTLNDFVYSADVLSTATVGAGLYTSGSASLAATGVTVTNNSTLAFPRPIGVWLTEPGRRYDGTAPAVVEFFAAHAFAQGRSPVAAVVFTATDGAAHSVSHTVSVQTPSTRQLSTSCTATNGSPTLTGCASTAGFLPGMRATVLGIPGQPIILSTTPTSLTFGVTNLNCTTTLNSGDITLTNAAVGLGQGLADGAFVGASISDANITTPAGTAPITSATVTADVTNVSGKATAAKVHTSATGVTAATNAACTVNQNFQGTTGTVTVTLGNPVPVYAATFTTADLATLNDGVIAFRARAYPNIGNVILDTQGGADGTGVDWNGVAFNTFGTDISANLHNLWAYKDAGLNYRPVYAWVSGTAGGAPAVSTSAADPGSGAYFASVSTAVAALKAYYNTTPTIHHNDANGGIICLLAAGSPYSGFGGTIYTSYAANEPPGVITSALAGASCPASGAAGSDITVTVTHNATTLNSVVAAFTHVNNLTLADTAQLIQGLDGQNTTSMPTYSAIFEGDILHPISGGNPIIYKLGAWWLYNNLINGSTASGSVLTPLSVTGEPALVLGNTIVCGTFATGNVMAWDSLNDLGNDAWACAQQDTKGPEALSYVVRPLSSVKAFNRIMGETNTSGFCVTSCQNEAFVANIFEVINDSVGQPAWRMSPDNTNTPASNIVRQYNTGAGNRFNGNYLEGIPTNTATGLATGGALPAGTYFFQITYAVKSAPSPETSTDGVNINSVVVGGTGAGSINLQIQSDPNYVAYVYADTVNPPAHLATINGADAKQLAMGQAYVITGLGSAQAAPVINVGGITGHNEQKFSFFQRFNIDENYNTKNDTYGSSGATSSGGRVGNWASRWFVSVIGNISATGTLIGSGFSPTSGYGEINCYLCTSNPANSQSDLSWVKYKSDRSAGASGTIPVAPALNLGEGDYCPDSSVTNAGSVVPSGLAASPTDISGAVRLNNGAGWAGAYETGCL